MAGMLDMDAGGDFDWQKLMQELLSSTTTTTTGEDDIANQKYREAQMAGLFFQKQLEYMIAQATAAGDQERKKELLKIQQDFDAQQKQLDRDLDYKKFQESLKLQQAELDQKWDSTVLGTKADWAKSQLGLLTTAMGQGYLDENQLGTITDTLTGAMGGGKLGDIEQNGLYSAAEIEAQRANAARQINDRAAGSAQSMANNALSQGFNPLAAAAVSSQAATDAGKASADANMELMGQNSKAKMDAASQLATLRADLSSKLAQYYSKGMSPWVKALIERSTANTATDPTQGFQRTGDAGKPPTAPTSPFVTRNPWETTGFMTTR